MFDSRNITMPDIGKGFARKSMARFELRQGELPYLGAMYIASGNWEGLDNLEEVARDFLLRIISGLKKHGYYTIRDIVWIMQNTLMAQRKSHFYTIQKQPPFMRFTFNNMVLLDEAWVSGGGEGFSAKWNQIFAPGWRDLASLHDIVRLTGGPGDSADTAFTVHAPDYETRVCAEYWYLYYTYGRMYKDWQPRIQRLTSPDELGRQFDVIDLRLPDGGERTVFFLLRPQAAVM